MNKMGRRPLVGDGGITLDSLRVSRHIADALESMAQTTGVSVPELRRHILDRFFADLKNQHAAIDEAAHD
jgi:hypothetical protein